MKTPYRTFMEWKTILQFFRDIGANTGAMDGKTIKEEKVQVKGHCPGPGSKVKIAWIDGVVDRGYIFTLPGIDSDDVFMSGIVHVPSPSVYEKGNPEPEWQSLARLSRNKLVRKIVIG